MGCSSSSRVIEGQVSTDKIMFMRLKLGKLEMPNRFVVAATTRLRAGNDGVPNELMLQYYSARASSGLIITESSGVSQEGNCYPMGGGIFTEAQVNGWKRITDAVHAKGGRIFIQLHHGGRVVHPEMNEGQIPFSSSAVRACGEVHLGKCRKQHTEPKEATQQDINNILQQFRKAAENAKKAGFDGVEIQGGSGFLIDQFLKDGVNKRTDKYGGSFENRTRFLLEVVDQVAAVFGHARVGVKYSPFSNYNDMSESDPIGLAVQVTKELNKKKIAFLEIQEVFTFDETNDQKRDQFFADKQHKSIRPYLKPLFTNGAYIANGGFDYQKAHQIIQSKEVDAVSFGTLYICNPDLVERCHNNTPLRNLGNVKDMGKLWSTYFYMGGAEGYTNLSPYEP